MSQRLVWMLEAEKTSLPASPNWLAMKLLQVWF
jgi:hypothetical protein